MSDIAPELLSTYTEPLTLDEVRELIIAHIRYLEEIANETDDYHFIGGLWESVHIIDNGLPSQRNSPPQQ